MFLKENFIGKKCLIIGGGKSGLSAAKLLNSRLKCDVIISDSKPLNTRFKTIMETEANKIINTVDFAVKSPGIGNENVVLKKLKELEIPIFSEVEVALSFSKTENIIMITGTNGKSTTTYLTWLILDNYLKKRNSKAILCGNIGKPISKEILKSKKDDWVVAEISSYQIEDSTYIKHKIAMILNITPDHIEHHGNMENYINAKFKIFSFMDRNDTLIINKDDKILNKLRNKKFKILSFSLKDKKANSYFEKGKIILKHNEKTYKLNPAKIPGEHNLQNQMAAIIAAIEAEADYKTIQNTLNLFKGLEHRIEIVREINGVTYINDSKATNVDSTLIALKALGKKKNIWLIMGGVHKNAPYTPLLSPVKKYVKKILLIGESASIIEKDLGKSQTVRCETLENAVKYAFKNASRGDIVLLSPACASFDQFKNYEDRGRKFKKAVNML